MRSQAAPASAVAALNAAFAFFSFLRAFLLRFEPFAFWTFAFAFSTRAFAD